MAIKIHKEQSFQETGLKLPSSGTKTATPFTSHIGDQRTRLQTNALEKLLGNIDHQGERLVRSKTIKDVQVYKRYINQFIQEAVKFGLGTKESRSWHQPSGPHQLIIKKIDEKLLLLTDDVLNKESKSLDLLGKLGEIKGLLVNLYI